VTTGSLVRRARAWMAAVATALACVMAGAAVLEPAEALLLPAADTAPPAADRAWQRVALPDLWHRSRPQAPRSVAWYRVDFQFPEKDAGQPWAVYLPYLAYGGQIWLNDELVAQLPENSPQAHVRWIRPHLAALPRTLLHPGDNQLLVRAALPPPGPAMNMPRLGIGPLAELAGLYERRFFWLSVTPYITAAVCLLVAAFVLFIWWRRRSEVMYGLFGIAAALWGIRTLTFVIEVVPMQWWLLWRTAYLGATGGFIVATAVLAMRYAGIRKPWIERSLAAYWLVGPLWLLLGGVGAEPLVNRYWIAGFLPIGMSIVAVSVAAMWRLRTLASAVLPSALAIGALAGLNDYAVNWNVGVLNLLPGWTEWAGHRIFLLHHGANLLLVGMGGLLTMRFVQTLASLEELNRTLETRVADRERELSENYRHMAALQRQNVAAQERQLIMREIHDGLGSQLFVSLSRVERGDMQGSQIADALRDCIADMRIALDTLAPGDDDFRSALGNFMFRWQQQLAAAGVTPAWTIDVPDRSLSLSPHASLALLRIVQEALTNVLKHAGARKVQVRFRQARDALELEVEDDGCGAAARSAPGRGLDNMRARARQLGGRLDVRMGRAGTCVALQVPMNAVLA
jgi:signal transduction histidine kinase